MKKIILLLFTSILFSLNILILNSYSAKLKWTQNELNGILNELNDQNLNIYVEFMDTKLFRPTPERLKNFYNYIFNKYKKIPFDIIIVTDDNALNFVRKNINSALFSNAKVFFAGINNLKLAKILDKNRFAGVFEKKEPVTNLQFASKIVNLKTLYVVGDNSNSAKIVMKQYKKAYKTFKNIKFVYINEKELTHLLYFFKDNYSNDSAMMLINPFSFNYENRHISYKKAVQLLSKVYKRPIVVHTDILVNIKNSNVVGGKVNDSHNQGKIAAIKVKEYLNKKQMKKLGFTFEKANKMYLNVLNLKKFGVNAYYLGYKNAVYVNKPQTLWKKYKNEIILMLLSFLYLVLVIVILIYKNILLKELNREKEKLNFELQKRINSAVEDIQKKDKLLANHAKLSAMSDMMGAVAHQWRQPLNALAINLQVLPEISDKNKYSEIIDKNLKIINFMSNTIDNFIKFFKNDENELNFSVKTSIKETLDILDAQLNAKKIIIEFKGDDFYIKGNKNQFRQVILNIINNSKEAFKNQKNKKIEIILKNKLKKIYILDNAGGIEKNLLDKIFEPYFTTKDKGSGLGLYISKIILEKYFNANLLIKNTKIGVINIISF
ncbi:HAMP domain-containing sensor histidine kinase [Lebetimonas sp. JS032]|uniref:sensor histidine kinase n=1 Tax=Lebetimonas sp. JS032 TaxID=990070 RepID=UPI00046708CB|nr:HAMP domain-containing sensor histidine kinase [Lebetimonas sp. JS032]